MHKFGYSYATVFDDFLDICLSALLSFNDNLQRADFLKKFKEQKLTGIYEDQYMQLVAKYKENKEREQGKRPADYFANAWAYLQKETIGCEQDILGELFMQHISHGEHGQFFTPVNVTDMMAQIVGTQGTTVSDPACGSGRLFISMSKHNENQQYTGVDLSPTCAKMTALNMWMFDLDADIYHGDSLSMKMFRVWKIRKGGYIYSEEVKELPEPVKVQMKEQQSLFDVQEYRKKKAA